MAQKVKFKIQIISHFPQYSVQLLQNKMTASFKNLEDNKQAQLNNLK